LVEAQTAIAELNQNLIGRGEASALFGQVREAGLESILGNLALVGSDLARSQAMKL
jgi:hypothetical protein